MKAAISLPSATSVSVEHQPVGVVDDGQQLGLLPIPVAGAVG
jgi:hypothetical protein